MALPFPVAALPEIPRWETAHATAIAVKDFINTSIHSSLRHIEFVASDHRTADTLTVVFS